MSVHHAPVNRQTLREQVLDALRAAVTSGELPLGAPLVENDLAATYGVSRGTVREALRELQAAGLVTGDSRGKLHVRTPSPREIAEIFRVRGALEGLAAREVSARADKDELVADLRESLPPHTATGDFATQMNADLAFHERLVALSGNATLLRLWQELEDQMRLVFFARATHPNDRLMTRDQHAPILDAVASGDDAAIHAIVREHMDLAVRAWAPGESGASA